MSVEEREPAFWGYIRASTEEQRGTLLTQKEELEEAGCVRVFVDDDQSGMSNMTDEGTAWQELSIIAQPGDRVVVISLSRLGRENHELIYAVGQLNKRGISVWTLDDNLIYDDINNETQILNLNIKSFSGTSEVLKTRARTKTALGLRSAAGMKLGQKPKLSRSHVAYIHTLHEEGHGIKHIAGAVKVYSKKYGKEMPISPTTVQKVLKGTYGMTVEEWQATNDKAREQMYKTADAMRRVNQMKREEKADA
ncbi:recombinase family protein [Microbacterium sp. 179-I 3D3 NHS]|uniref:recombinase family protein n=1 Tax=Microbacterium sp. 179-I 3D3 NHS TaxID=3142382 RepID=UPI0039A02E83